MYNKIYKDKSIMECIFAIKYGNKRSYLAKMYARLTSSVQKPEVVEFVNSLSYQI